MNRIWIYPLALLLFCLAACMQTTEVREYVKYESSDTTKDGYSLVYKILSDSLEVEYLFTNADSPSFPFIAISFGDSSMSAILEGDTTIRHVYPVRTSYQVGLVGRASESEPWHVIKSMPIELLGWHPSVEQLLGCKRVEFRIHGLFKRTDNWGATTRDTATVTAGWNLADLNGAQLSSHSEQSYQDEYYNRYYRRNVKVNLLEEGAVAGMGSSSYSSDVERSGGYGEIYEGSMSFRDIAYTGQDSIRYIYRIEGGLAAQHLQYSLSYNNRFSRWSKSLASDSLTPIGEISFFK